ncbi:MAG: NAD(P)H-dependent oxidoreductase [Pseudomonadota bacterium]
MVPRILVFAGSVRTGSLNARLANAAQLSLAQLGADVTRISLIDYPMPLVSEDLKAERGIPESVMQLGRMIADHHGVFIASPEYNSSFPPLLKNAVDWVSLISEDNGAPLKPWRGRYVALGAASNGRLGGIRGLYHLRSVMMNVGSQIITEQCSVAGASTAFDDDDRIIDERTDAILQQTCKSLIEHCRHHSAVE